MIDIKDLAHEIKSRDRNLGIEFFSPRFKRPIFASLNSAHPTDALLAGSRKAELKEFGGEQNVVDSKTQRHQRLRESKVADFEF